MEIFVLDGKRMTSREAAHALIARVLCFPAYYGANLDALADCLGELSPCASVILINPGALRASLGEYAERMISVFLELSARESAFGFIISE